MKQKYEHSFANNKGYVAAARVSIQKAVAYPGVHRVPVDGKVSLKGNF